MKRWVSFCALAVLTSCGTAPENDPIYQALRANQPTEIPAKHLSKLRRGGVSCDVYNEGRADQYMTCWWPNGSGTVAYMSYYGPRAISPPRPSKIIAPGGEGVTGYLKIQ